jgi:hypothetical protein
VVGSWESEDEEQNSMRSEEWRSFTLFKYQVVHTQNQLQRHYKNKSFAGVEEISVVYKNHTK